MNLSLELQTELDNIQDNLWIQVSWCSQYGYYWIICHGDTETFLNVGVIRIRKNAEFTAEEQS